MAHLPCSGPPGRGEACSRGRGRRRERDETDETDDSERANVMIERGGKRAETEERERERGEREEREKREREEGGRERKQGCKVAVKGP